ncbi:hypothetical protein GCM10009827_097210 [Dactylosporangium maewongense]|uniref:TIR domain-containing protein n=1 Tax=Dactylosporangium maewongense TaxID=634393 RepID=A0ABN2CLB4_9ACTN
MYNLLVGFPDEEAYAERVVEYTDEAIRSYIEPGGRLDTSRLLNLPTLVLPETGNDQPQIARVGRLESMKVSGKVYHFRFVPSPTMPAIPSARIGALAARLGISDWEFRRTHWAVKDVDLYHVLHEVASTAPTVFRLPLDCPQERDLVAVMMPFDRRFDPVHEALRRAAADAGLRCQRADDIWRHAHIMDDVVSLIWRAQFVISDFTDKSPNVFYETGIAHSYGRTVIPITQSPDDVPFDLRSIRSVRYLSNGEGLELLRAQVANRLRELVVAHT